MSGAGEAGDNFTSLQSALDMQEMLSEMAGGMLRSLVGKGFDEHLAQHMAVMYFSFVLDNMRRETDG